MLFLFGTFASCQDAARAQGLERWQHLHHPLLLAGAHEPDVVMLGTAHQLTWFNAIMAQLDARGATIWSEGDLRDGKVPR